MCSVKTLAAGTVLATALSASLLVPAASAAERGTQGSTVQAHRASVTSVCVITGDSSGHAVPYFRALGSGPAGYVGAGSQFVTTGGIWWDGAWFNQGYFPGGAQDVYVQGIWVNCG
ncbi:hypothetical protein [Streptomyces winkii]|uniref:hypothetical protein n=1 Tax=Streptomyces winkii TaxID=3051178 RepID=UPI0028D4F3D0|nr:hypothetical protein [Streptomyces sp. DSM 40971]